MEYEKVFTTVGVVLLCVIAYFTLIGQWNADYGASVGASANQTYAHVQSLSQSNLYNLSNTMANSTILPSGPSQETGQTSLIARSLNIITQLPTLLGLIPALLNDFASILGVPPAYVNIATWIFLFTFASIFAYLLLLGIRRVL